MSALCVTRRGPVELSGFDKVFTCWCVQVSGVDIHNSFTAKWELLQKVVSCQTVQVLSHTHTNQTYRHRLVSFCDASFYTSFMSL